MPVEKDQMSKRRKQTSSEQATRGREWEMVRKQHGVGRKGEKMGLWLGHINGRAT